MNEFIADAIVARARARLHASPTPTAGTPQAGAGGLISRGATLSPEVAAACDDARLTAPRFASLRNLSSSRPEELRHEPYPNDLSSPPIPSSPRKTGKGSSISSRPASDQIDHEAYRSQREARIAAGPIPIEELYLEGVYQVRLNEIK